MIGLLANDGTKRGHRFLGAVGIEQGIAQTGVDRWYRRAQCHGGLEHGHGLVRLAGAAQRVAEIEMCLEIVWHQGNGGLIFGNGVRVRRHAIEHIAEVVMRLCQRRVVLHGGTKGCRAASRRPCCTSALPCALAATAAWRGMGDSGLEGHSIGVDGEG